MGLRLLSRLRNIFAAAIFTLALLAPKLGMAEARLALIIANQSYSPQVGALGNPHKDAKLMREALERQGFEVTVIKDATRGQILAAVDHLADRLQASEPEPATGFLYYAGHGLAEPQRAQNYIIPVNVIDAKSRAIWYDSVKLDEVRMRLSDGAPNAAHVVVFDACRNELALPTRGGGNGFVAVSQLGGMLTAFSASPGQLASDGGASDEAGPYASALVKQLDAALASPNPVPAATIFSQVRLSLVNSDTPQEPIYSDGLNRVLAFGGEAEMPERTDPATQEQQPRAAPEVSLLSREEAAMRAYSLAQELNSVAAFRDVQELYSDTLGGRQAGRRADAMEQEAEEQARRGLIRQQAEDQERQQKQAEELENGRRQAEVERLELERRQAENERLEQERLQAEAERLEAQRRQAEAEQQERQRAEAEERQEEARVAQQELQRLGLYTRAIDGDWGRGSRQALAAFQEQIGLSPADGVLTPAILAALKQAPTPTQPKPAAQPEAAKECFSFEGAVWCAGE